MKIFLVIIILFSVCLSGCNNNNSNITESNTSNSNNNDVNTNTSENYSDNANVETEISSFSTKIYTPNDDARQNNLKITCSTLNGTIVGSRRNLFFL